MTNLGAADAVVGLEKEFDVEGGVVLARDRWLGRRRCELARPPGPVLAGYVLGGYPSQDRGDPGDLPEVVARLSGAFGLGVIMLRHFGAPAQDSHDRYHPRVPVMCHDHGTGGGGQKGASSLKKTKTGICA